VSETPLRHKINPNSAQDPHIALDRLREQLETLQSQKEQLNRQLEMVRMEMEAQRKELRAAEVRIQQMEESERKAKAKSGCFIL
jgi:TolA-binding protein